MSNTPREIRTPEELAVWQKEYAEYITPDPTAPYDVKRSVLQQFWAEYAASAINPYRKQH
jgi:hypothetical protein